MAGIPFPHLLEGLGWIHTKKFKLQVILIFLAIDDIRIIKKLDNFQKVFYFEVRFQKILGRFCLHDLFSSLQKLNAAMAVTTIQCIQNKLIFSAFIFFKAMNQAFTLLADSHMTHLFPYSLFLIGEKSFYLKKRKTSPDHGQQDYAPHRLVRQ